MRRAIAAGSTGPGLNFVRLEMRYTRADCVVRGTHTGRTWFCVRADCVVRAAGEGVVVESKHDRGLQ